MRVNITHSMTGKHCPPWEEAVPSPVTIRRGIKRPESLYFIRLKGTVIYLPKCNGCSGTGIK